MDAATPTYPTAQTSNNEGKMAKLSSPWSDGIRFHFGVATILHCIASNNAAIANARRFQHGMGFVSQHHHLHRPDRLMGMKATRHQRIIFKNSQNDDNESTDSTESQDRTAENNMFITEDPDGVPLFDTNDRATLFGLDPKAELDSMDNGLAFTGPIIFFFSMYFTLSLFFPTDEIPPIFEDIARNSV